MHRKIKDGFIILLLAADAIRLFGKKLKFFRIVAVTQSHRCLRLILNLSAQPDSDKPSFNRTINRDATP